MGRKLAWLGVAVLALSASVTEAQAQVRVGGQLSWAEDHDMGIGPRIVLTPAPLLGLRLIGTFDYFFADNVRVQGNEADVNYWELNGNLVWGFQIVNAPGFEPYVGAGVNFAHRSRKIISGGTQAESSRELVGLNILGGAEFPLAPITPFVEVRVEIEGGEQFVISGGFLIP